MADIQRLNAELAEFRDKNDCDHETNNQKERVLCSKSRWTINDFLHFLQSMAF